MMELGRPWRRTTPGEWTASDRRSQRNACSPQGGCVPMINAGQHAAAERIASDLGILADIMEHLGDYAPNDGRVPDCGSSGSGAGSGMRAKLWMPLSV